jgi:16S rRNA processing protein RimM
MSRRCSRSTISDAALTKVVTVEGVKLGRVSHLVATGANDVLVARDGGRERLIPFVLDDYVKEVDFEAGRITVDWDPEF